jgi:hypothetical protein
MRGDTRADEGEGGVIVTIADSAVKLLVAGVVDGNRVS